MTTPDEVDPSSDEFSLITKQWDLIPILLSKLYSLFSADNPRIVVRPHPNFFSRFNCPISNLDSKINTLVSNMSHLPNTYFDFNPSSTSSFALFRLSTLSVTFASSSSLESEYCGTPSLVPSNHIYKHGCSYIFDGPQLVRDSTQFNLDLSVNNMDQLHVRSRDKLIKFAYLWFYLDKFHFNSLSSTSFSTLIYNSKVPELSQDCSILKSVLLSHTSLVEDKFHPRLI